MSMLGSAIHAENLGGGVIVVAVVPGAAGRDPSAASPADGGAGGDLLADLPA